MTVLFQFPYKYGGGRVANEWVQSHFGVDKVVHLETPRRFKYFRDLLFLSYKYRNDKIILNGLLSFPLGLFFKRIDVVINHNVESYLFNSGFIKIIVNHLQQRVNRVSAESVFFNERDAKTLSIENYKVCTPIIMERGCDLPEALSQFNAIIPTNLNYKINIKGLTRFYKESRSGYPGKRILISTQSFDKDQCEYLFELIEEYGDELMYLPKCQYIKALETFNVFLIAYEGSGIQVKALEATYYANVVYATNFIINSDERFSGFIQIRG